MDLIGLVMRDHCEYSARGDGRLALFLSSSESTRFSTCATESYERLRATFLFVRGPPVIRLERFFFFLLFLRNYAFFDEQFCLYNWNGPMGKDTIAMDDLVLYGNDYGWMTCICSLSFLSFTQLRDTILRRRQKHLMPINIPIKLELQIRRNNALSLSLSPLVCVVLPCSFFFFSFVFNRLALRLLHTYRPTECCD